MSKNDMITYSEDSMAFKKNQRCDCEWMGRKSCVPGHLASHQSLVTLHMQKVGEIGWQIRILLTTVESYLSSPFGSTQKRLARQCAKCVSACMNIAWYPRVEKREETALKLVSKFPWVCKVCECMYVTSFFKYSQTYPYPVLFLLQNTKQPTRHKLLKASMTHMLILSSRRLTLSE